ncbi:hypothetical protein FDK12_14300 [Arthrobacter sp. NamB2]|uniref:hypothetical protein n=1 Tax=Arthrobacter sp. NamB2 TaxID=2576035 RepID=UPI0010C9DEEF|nr:hypothetical protein [Arthrobacter sp. NamB2]TKV26128.1 hypothetical protein FDK12_14300 [Arthrobacter sp. NamB2]
MITASWTAYYREDDGELLGYLVPDGELFVPVTVFGYELGDAVDEYYASQVLESIGLSYLADTWVLSIADRNEPINVQIVEASPEALKVKSVDYGWDQNYGTIIELPVPEPGKLRRH